MGGKLKKINLRNIDHHSRSKIFIGENGGGKSTLLRELSEFYISSNNFVLAISNCLHDKFDISSRKFKCMSVKHGENVYKMAVLGALGKIENDNVRFVLGRALDYCGYSDEIGLSLSSDKKYYPNASFRENETYWIPINNNFPGMGYSNSSNQIVSFLKNSDNKNIVDVKIYLKDKCGDIIPFGLISSGQANKISTLAYLSSHMRDDLVIMIDEPENSLHPKWQREYIDDIFNVFYGASFSLVVATHSPLIINRDSEVYEVDNFKVKLKRESSLNIEERLWYLFDVVTPENEFLSRYLVHVLDSYRSNTISMEDALSKLDDLSKACSDKRQENVIEDVKDVIRGYFVEFMDV